MSKRRKNNKIKTEPDNMDFLIPLSGIRLQFPSALMRIDAALNFSRHLTPSLERSPGFFSFFDMDGKSAPYLLWRRSESHAIIPKSYSLNDGTWSPDPLPNIKSADDGPPPVTGAGYDAPRIHPINSPEKNQSEKQLKDWINVASKRAPLGVSLIIAQDDYVGDITSLISKVLEPSGDVFIPESIYNQHKNFFNKNFSRIYFSDGYVILFNFKNGKKEAEIIDLELPHAHREEARFSDPLLAWILVNA